MRRYIGIWGIVLVACWTVAPAWACRCVPNVPWSAYYQEADAVVMGRVEKLSGNPWSPAGSVARIDVERAWKADVDHSIPVHTATSCAFEFAPGVAYLLFLKKLPDGGYSTRACAGNLRQKQAGDLLRWLDERGRVARVRECSGTR